MQRTTKALVAAGITVTLMAGLPSATGALRRGSATESNSIVLPLPTPAWLMPQGKFPDLQEKGSAPKGTSPRIPVVPVVPLLPIDRQLNPCRLTTQDVHFRKSTSRRDIGPKPKTTCTRVVERIEHFTQMQYLIAGKWWNHGPVLLDEDANIAELETKDIAIRCLGTASTTWRSATKSKIRDGATQYKLAVTSNASKLNCSI